MKPVVSTEETTAEALDWNDVMDTIQCFEIKNEPEANEVQVKVEESLTITANVVHQAGQPREEIFVQKLSKESYSVERASNRKTESPKKVRKNESVIMRDIQLDHAIDNGKNLARKTVREIQNGHLTNKKQACESLRVAGVDHGSNLYQSLSPESNSIVIDCIFVPTRHIKDTMKDICRPSYVKLYDFFKNPQEMRKAVQGEFVCFDVKREEQDEENMINVAPKITIQMSPIVTYNKLQTCKTEDYIDASKQASGEDCQESMMDGNVMEFQCCQIENVINDPGKGEDHKLFINTNTQEVIYATKMKSRKYGKANKIRNNVVISIINELIDRALDEKSENTAVCIDLDEEKNQNCWMWDHRGPDLTCQLSVPVPLSCGAGDNNMAISSSEVLQECKERLSRETQFRKFSNAQNTAVYLKSASTGKIISREDRSATNNQDNVLVKEKAKNRHCISASTCSIQHTSLHCHICDQRFRYKHFLYRHLKEVHKSAKPGISTSTDSMNHTSLHCHICDQRFKHRYSLYRHLKEIHRSTKPGSYTCDKCGWQYSSKQTLHRHQKRGCSEYKCLLCSKTFISKYNLRKHKELWCNETKIKIKSSFKCEMCTKTYSSISNLKTHQQHHHHCDTHFLYKCETCSRKYVSEKYYKEHLAKGHQTLEAVCEICGLIFLSAQRKFVHKQKEHLKKSTQFLCSHCGKSFQTKGKFEKHTNTHIEIYKYQCSKCDKGFGSKSHLEKHMQCVHSNIKTCICELCGKLFKTSMQLTQHRKSIHLGIKRYSCEHCSASFYMKEALNVHYRSHTSETPFPCKECDKKFKTISQLKTHAKIHSDVREHKCPACQVGFKLPHHLRAHLARKHATAP